MFFISRGTPLGRHPRYRRAASRLSALLLGAAVLASCAGAPRPSGSDAAGVSGWTAPGFEGLRKAFAENLERRGELGGAFAAYVDGELVADLWGGWADPKLSRPWERDTSVVVFSATKGVGAMVLAHLHSRGLLDYDAPVARYWPEFATKGKEAVTVRQLLSHQAGIVLPPEPIDRKDFAGMARILGETEPLWTPGDYQGYHAGTIGYAMQVLTTRIDPEGRSLDRYLQEELAGPLGADFRIGADADYDRSRLAVLKPFSPAEALLHLGEMPPGLRKVVFDSKSLFWRSMGGGSVDVNSAEYIEGEEPSGNGLATARGLAALYGELASGGARTGFRPETLDAVFGPAESPRLSRLDRVMNLEAYYGLGFQKPNPEDGWFCEDPGAIGFLGASGAIGVADRGRGLGFAYVTNRMSPGNQVGDPREKALREALYAALRSREARP